MEIDPGVLASIAALVEQDPTNVPLKLHLADLLLTDGQSSTAQAHIVAALALQPDDVKALSLAARAAEALGDPTRAAAYRRLCDSLEPTSPESPDVAEPGTASGGLDGSTQHERVPLRLIEGSRVTKIHPENGSPDAETRGTWPGWSQ